MIMSLLHPQVPIIFKFHFKKQHNLFKMVLPNLSKLLNNQIHKL